MGWVNYYHLLEKYDGDISRATPRELAFAARCNPDNPPDALAFAQKKWDEHQKV